MPRIVTGFAGFAGPYAQQNDLETQLFAALTLILFTMLPSSPRTATTITRITGQCLWHSKDAVSKVVASCLRQPVLVLLAA